MRRLASKIGRYLIPGQTRNRKNRSRPKTGRRLELEFLEDRCVPTGTATGVISGVAFVDSFGTGDFHSPDPTIPGVNLILTGTTSQKTPVTALATTDASGAFTFDNVLPGTYGLSGQGGSLFLGVPSVGGLSVTGGQTVTQNLSFRGFTPSVISMRLFLASTAPSDFPFAPAGSGTGLANFRPNNTPVVISAIAPITVGKNTSNPT